MSAPIFKNDCRVDMSIYIYDAVGNPRNNASFTKSKSCEDAVRYLREMEKELGRTASTQIFVKAEVRRTVTEHAWPNEAADRIDSLYQGKMKK